MDKINLKGLFTEKGKDYTYAIIFFLIFSFFTFFVIRPNILTVFEANLKIENLKKNNASYEAQIQNIINAQSVLVDARDQLVFLDEAITKKPEVNELIRGVTNILDKNKLTIDKINLVDVNIKDVSRTNELKTIVFDFGLTGQFEDISKLIKDLYDQRRLNLLRNIDIERRTEAASVSGELKINFQLEGYYL